MIRWVRVEGRWVQCIITSSGARIIARRRAVEGARGDG